MGRFLHWVASYPWPVGQQDYVLKQGFHSEKAKDDCVLRCIQNVSLDEAEATSFCPCHKGASRIAGYRCHLAVWPAEEGKTSFAMLVFNAKSKVMNCAANFAIASQLPRELSSMVTVASSYPPSRVQETLSLFDPSCKSGSSLLEHVAVDVPAKSSDVISSTVNDTGYNSSDVALDSAWNELQLGKDAGDDIACESITVGTESEATRCKNESYAIGRSIGDDDVTVAKCPGEERMNEMETKINKDSTHLATDTTKQ